MAQKRKRTRTQKYLRPNHGSSIPHEWIFMQTIAAELPIKGRKKEKLQRLDIGVAHAVRLKAGQWRCWNQIEFTGSQPFWPWLYGRIRKNTALWLCGHGIAKSFTLVDGWGEITRRTLRLTRPAMDSRSLPTDEKQLFDEQEGWLVDQDPPTILQLYHPFGVLHVVDSRNYHDAEIADYAQDLGRPAPAAPPDRLDPDAWFQHLADQCVIVSDWMLEFLKWWKANDLGQWRHTLASLAMSAYRHRFMKARILIHDCEFALEKEREAMAGGEIRCFAVGPVGQLEVKGKKGSQKKDFQRTLFSSDNVHELDVNSLYPYVMKTHWMPRELLPWKRPCDIDDYNVWSKELLLIGRVMLDCENATYPFYCDGIRYWAAGKFWATLAGPELARAVRLGHVAKWDCLVPYLKGNLFEEFVDYFHRQRLLALGKGQELRAKQAKILMNSLPGKFAQRNPQWQFVNFTDPPVDYGTFPVINTRDKTIKIFRAIAGYVQEQQVSTESLESCPAINAFVTAWARDYMRELRDAAGAGNVLYQSTDMLHVTDQGLARLKPFRETYAGELGKLRLIATYQRAEYRGPHDYTCDGTHTIAGVPVKAQFDKNGRTAQWQEQTLKTILTHEPGGFLKIREVVHFIGGRHPHGIMHEDDLVTPPVVLNGCLYQGPIANLPLDVRALGMRMRAYPQS